MQKLRCRNSRGVVLSALQTYPPAEPCPCPVGLMPAQINPSAPSEHILSLSQNSGSHAWGSVCRHLHPGIGLTRGPASKLHPHLSGGLVWDSETYNDRDHTRQFMKTELLTTHEPPWKIDPTAVFEQTTHPSSRSAFFHCQVDSFCAISHWHLQGLIVNHLLLWLSHEKITMGKE